MCQECFTGHVSTPLHHSVLEEYYLPSAWVESASQAFINIMVKSGLTVGSTAFQQALHHIMQITMVDSATLHNTSEYHVDAIIPPMLYPATQVDMPFKVGPPTKACLWYLG